MSPTIDVTAERTIAAPPEAVAAVMFDPVNDSKWMKAVKSAERLDSTGGAARVRRTGSFLGKTIQWTTELLEHDPPRRLRLLIADGPFNGEVTYEIEPAGTGSRVRIRNVGEPGMFAWMPRFMTMAAMRTALGKDLEHL